MSVVIASYSKHNHQNKLIFHDLEMRSFHDMCLLLDEYPWEKELALASELGESGGFQFVVQQDTFQYASFVYRPVAKGEGILDLDVLVDPGFLDFFGRKAVSRHFDVVNVVEAKEKMKELFDAPIEHLYEKYRSRRSFIAS